MDKSTVPIHYTKRSEEVNEMMDMQSYYRDIDIPGCDMPHDTEPLVLNCAGYCCVDEAFASHCQQGRSDYYLQYMTAGHMTAWPSGEAEAFTDGMFIVYRPHTPFRYELTEGETMQYHWIHFSGFYAGRLLQNLGIETNRTYKTDGSENRKERIIHCFEKIFSEFVNLRPGADNYCSALLTEIMVDLARGVDQMNTGDKRTLDSLVYLHSHYREESRIADLAAMEHLSESRYREVFRQHTGFSPSDYRTALRMQHACDLLALTDTTITKIAEDCGYSDVLYFLRIFKRKKGITPGEYRSQHRQRKTDSPPPFVTFKKT